jgi:putative transposase
VALIKEMAVQNRLWGAERIRGEVLKLGIHVSQRTIQKYMSHACSPRRRGQTWATFLQNYAKDMWACDFLQVTDLCWLLALSVLKIRKETVNKNLSRHLFHVETTRIWNG